MKNHVVCLSTTNYHPLPTRKQNVMSRLRNSEVLYFDPPVSLIAPLKDKKASAPPDTQYPSAWQETDGIC